MCIFFRVVKIKRKAVPQDLENKQGGITGIGKLPTSMTAQNSNSITATKKPSFELPKSPVPHLDSNEDKDSK